MDGRCYAVIFVLPLYSSVIIVIIIIIIIAHPSVLIVIIIIVIALLTFLLRLLQVIQRRDDFGEPRETFNREWNDYKHGFGNPDAEFWLGNENIYMLTNTDDHMLRVELEDFDGNRR